MCAHVNRQYAETLHGVPARLAARKAHILGRIAETLVGRLPLGGDAKSVETRGLVVGPHGGACVEVRGRCRACSFGGEWWGNW